jgi:hypothetical protein
MDVTRGMPSGARMALGILRLHDFLFNLMARGVLNRLRGKGLSSEVILTSRDAWLTDQKYLRILELDNCAG